MEMNGDEYQAVKETLNETKDLADELNLTLLETIQLRQLVAIRWLCNRMVNE